MKKILYFVVLTALAVVLLSSTAFAVQPRWANVTSVVPTTFASSGSYSCTIDCLPGTTKIECTMTLYEKNWLGNYIEVSRTSDTYNGSYHVFMGYHGIQSGRTYMLVIDATVIRSGAAEPISYTFEKKC